MPAGLDKSGFQPNSDKTNLLQTQQLMSDGCMRKDR